MLGTVTARDAYNISKTVITQRQAWVPQADATVRIRGTHGDDFHSRLLRPPSAKIRPIT
jgi:hypothetical protein